jgi:D-glycero-D-manno-heptose 1,7-bisphosphate phosphatase
MRAVFLDRDGVINEDRDDYVKNLNELIIFAQVPKVVRALNDAGYAVFVISNQQGVAKGIIAEMDLYRIQNRIAREVEAAGGKIAGFYYCTHFASDKCSCRKPQPGMILKAASEHDIDLGASFMIGDSEKDVIAGRAAGCRTVLVMTGHVGSKGSMDDGCDPDYVAQDLAEAAEWVLASSRS